MTQKIYNSNSVISNHMMTDEFSSNSEMKQGEVYMDEITKKVTAKSRQFMVCYKDLQKVEITEGVFTDDVVVIAQNEKIYRKT